MTETDVIQRCRQAFLILQENVVAALYSGEIATFLPTMYTNLCSIAFACG